MNRSQLRRKLQWFHPKAIAHRRHLSSLPLDLSSLPRPLAEPGPRDVIVTGSQRSGTSLASAALHQPPRVVSIVEPWDGFRLPAADLFAHTRSEIRRTGRVEVGSMDYVALADTGRVKRVPEGQGTTSVSVDDDYLLAIKWPAFYRYLDELPTTKFVVCLRHPVEILSSFASQVGALRDGLDYQTALTAPMNAKLRAEQREPELRRIAHFDYIHERIIPHLDRPEVFVVRYERWFTERDLMMAEMATFLGEDIGPGPVSISAPKNRVAASAGATENPPNADRRLIELIKEHSRTAHLLGYDLD